MSALTDFYDGPDLADGFGSTASPRTRPHGGLDFAHAYGTPIPALFTGVVVGKGLSSELGYYTQVKSANGLVVTYCHSDRASHLNVGDTVRQGERVNYVAAKGFATGNHLHLATAFSLAIGYSYAEDPWPWVQKALKGEDIQAGATVPAGSTSGLTWAFNQPSQAVQLDIQKSLKARGRYDGPLDGIWGANTYKGIQKTIANVGYDGPIDGDIRGNGCRLIQVYAAKFGGYTGPIDAILGPNSWAAFANGLRP